MAPEGKYRTVEVPHDADTAYLAHGYYRYIGKFPPQIISYLFNRFEITGTIADPMTGGGTSLVEARLRGINAFACDINPVSRLISSVVSQTYDPGRLATELRRFIDRLRQCVGVGQFDDGNLFYDAKGGKKRSPLLAHCAEYFSDRTTRELSIYLGLLNDVPDPYRDVCLMNLFAVLRQVSRANIKKMNLEIDDSKQTRVTLLKAVGVQSERVIERHSRFAGWAKTCSISVIDKDAATTELDDSCVDAVVLHPPYLTNTAYSEFTQLQLAILGIDHRAIWKRELRCRGSFLHEPNGLQKYLIGWHQIIQEAARIVRPGGYVFTIVGDGQIQYVRIPVGDVTVSFARDLGLQEVDRFVHVLNNNTGRTQSRRMMGQHVSTFRKPA